MTIGERIKIVRNALDGKVTQAEFGAKLGVAREVITSYEIGRVIPPEPTIRLICSTYGINYHWLKDGDGPMYLPPDSDDELVDRVMTGENEFARRMFRVFARLTDEQWAIIKEIVDALAEENND